MVAISLREMSGRLSPGSRVAEDREPLSLETEMIAHGNHGSHGIISIYSMESLSPFG
jgi:hypothetical protein